MGLKPFKKRFFGKAKQSYANAVFSLTESSRD
jgi:hypothetical protein